jgi:hypothetical protein
MGKKNKEYFLDIYEKIKQNIKLYGYINLYVPLFEFGIEKRFERIIVRYYMNAMQLLSFSRLWLPKAFYCIKKFKEFLSAVDALYEIDPFIPYRNKPLVLYSIKQAKAFKSAQYQTDENRPRLSDFKNRFSSVSLSLFNKFY